MGVKMKTSRPSEREYEKSNSIHEGSNKTTLNILFQDGFNKNGSWKDILRMIL